jgi:hypothetical protein
MKLKGKVAVHTLAGVRSLTLTMIFPSTVFTA